jgi:hypothetical protein
VGQFLQDHRRAKLFRTGQRITRVYGPAFETGVSPEDTAERFRVSNAEMFGVAAGDLAPSGTGVNGPATLPLMYDPATGNYKFTLVYYPQHRSGIPVFRSEMRLLVRNELDYPLVLAASTLRDLGDFAVGDTSAAASFDPGRTAAPGLTSFTAPETVIWAGLGEEMVEPVLAVLFIGDNYESPDAEVPEKWLFVADARTGEILYQEDLIIHTNVTGNVSGMATEGTAADFCEAEVATPMAYAAVSIQGGNSAYADQNGDFVIPHGGDLPVTVVSPMNGQYFAVSDGATSEEVLTQSVTPPGPANFMHNAANSSEFIRAEVNGYIQANIVRDFVLAQNPSYPIIAWQTGFPVNVNLVGGYCPGNAWYDYSSINFCRAGAGYPNTAWSSIVHHEYGHHVIYCGGSGQGQYGEGMGDTIGVLISDDPGVGWGFFGNCNQPLRNADNNHQYPCSGGIHDCGQLLSGCVWSTRNELAATNPSNYLDILSNLTINSIPLHTGTMITPQITIDFLTLDDDDANIGNGTPHWSEICAGFGDHNMDCPPLDSGLSVSPSTGFASQGDAGGPFTPGSMDYTLDNIGDYSIGYSVTNSAPWLSLTNASGTLAPYASTVVTVSINSAANSLPESVYPDTVNFINTTDSAGDTTREVRLTVGVPAVVYEWTLDTDPGWTTTGLWAWGQPTGGGGQYGGPDPTGGYTGANVYGYNLDGDYANNLPERHLTSTAIDCSGLSGVTLKFQRWLGVEQPLWDHAYVRASNDGSSWTTIWENAVEVTDSSWTLQEFDISAVADNMPTVYLRWTMGTTDTAWQYCGWNIDDIQLVAVGGGPQCSVPADCDDGLFCNGAEGCVDEQCVAGSDPCPAQYCDEALPGCVDCLDDGHCDDGNACTVDTCVDGTCVHTPIVCDDGDACTADTCVDGDCVNTAIVCDDGDACTADTCVDGDCVNTAIVCDDGDSCTIDSCDSATGCVNDPVVCPPGEECVGGTCVPIVCDGDETCEPGEDCNNCPGDCFSGGGATCGNGVCETAAGEDCLSCPDDCNGKQNGKPSRRYCCGDGDGETPVDCNDGRCSGDGNTCSEVSPVPSCCGDGFCEGSEDGFNCEVDCGPPPTCGDGFCDPGEDQCNCSADCGSPPSSETNCADGVDEDCDGLTDCADSDCTPACPSCGPKGESCTADSDCCSSWCHRGSCK